MDCRINFIASRKGNKDLEEIFPFVLVFNSVFPKRAQLHS